MRAAAIAGIVPGLGVPADHGIALLAKPASDRGSGHPASRERPGEQGGQTEAIDDERPEGVAREHPEEPANRGVANDARHHRAHDQGRHLGPAAEDLLPLLRGFEERGRRHRRQRQQEGKTRRRRTVKPREHAG